MTDAIARLSDALTDRYRIERELGAGGMATVYLARDLRHDRQVAIKVLRPELAAVIGAERFLREIRTIAALQHPHILGLIDSGSVERRSANVEGEAPSTFDLSTFVFYVMPYVDGESLRDRLNREKQLPLRDAIRIASEVAGALDYAHRHGVIHRDIKPANILLHDGSALVADFGIALAVSRSEGSTRMTETGMSLGTPHYMSPEQAMGEREITARSDVYALGCVTYEMLVGDPPFLGSTAQAIVAKVMTERPAPPSALRDTVPPAVDTAVLTALAKLPADRFATAAEFAEALARETPAGRGGTRAAASTRRAPGRLVLGGVLLAGAALAGAAAGWWLHRPGPDGTPHPVRRATIAMSPQFDVRGAAPEISDDGSVIAVRDAMGLVVRRLDRLNPAVLPDTREAGTQFLSADGSRIGFIRAGVLVVERSDGSEPVAVPGPAVMAAAFLGDGAVVAVDSTGVVRLDLRTGQREPIMAVAGQRKLLQPCVCRNQRRVLFSAVGGDLTAGRIVAVDLAARRVDTLPLGPALRPQYSHGRLFFVRPTGAIWSVAYDPASGRITGEPAATGDATVLARAGVAEYAAGGGVLVYGRQPQNELVAFTPAGRRIVLSQQPSNYHNPRVSPDGSRVLVDIDAGGTAGRDVWTMSLSTGGLTRITSVGDAHDAVWTPDGTGVTYISFRTPGGQLVTAPADGSPGLRKMATTGEVNPGQWLADGRSYLAGISETPDNSDLLLLHADGSPPDTVVATRYYEHSPAVSPDGRWLAYTSDESGRLQIYLRPLHGAGRILVSEGPGEEPVWDRTAPILYYVERGSATTRLLSARFGAGTTPRITGRSVVLEDLSYEPVGNHSNWDTSPDGRMVFVEPVGGTQMVVVFDWAP